MHPASIIFWLLFQIISFMLSPSLTGIHHRFTSHCFIFLLYSPSNAIKRAWQPLNKLVYEATTQEHLNFSVFWLPYSSVATLCYKLLKTGTIHPSNLSFKSHLYCSPGPWLWYPGDNKHKLLLLNSRVCVGFGTTEWLRNILNWEALGNSNLSLLYSVESKKYSLCLSLGWD